MFKRMNKEVRDGRKLGINVGMYIAKNMRQNMTIESLTAMTTMLTVIVLTFIERKFGVDIGDTMIEEINQEWKHSKNKRHGNKNENSIRS